MRLYLPSRIRRLISDLRWSSNTFPSTSRQAARTADFAVRVFSVAIIATVPYSIAVSKLRRPFLSHRYFFIVVRLLRRREKFTEPDLARSPHRPIPVKVARMGPRGQPRKPDGGIDVITQQLLAQRCLAGEIGFEGVAKQPFSKCRVSPGPR